MYVLVFFVLLIQASVCSKPQCCAPLTAFNVDFFLMYKCGISICHSGEQSEASPCISCVPKIHSLNQRSLEIGSSILPIPKKVCEMFDGNASGRVVLEWEGPPAIYLIESTDSVSSNGKWDSVGMTNKTFAEISQLNPLYGYKFRVTSMTSGVLRPLTSEWIKVAGGDAVLRPPSNVSVSQFAVIKGSRQLQALVTWSPSPEMPCSYKLFWIPESGNDQFQQVKVQLPMDRLSAQLRGLLFGKNYTLHVVPLAVGRKAVPAQTWFQTPHCLDLTEHNFTLCAPGAPLNVSVRTVGGVGVVSWLPPAHSSSHNLLLQYRVTLEKNGIDVEFRALKKDVLNTSFVLTDKSATYLFEVKAVSEGGVSEPATVQLSFEGVATAEQFSSFVPYHYVLPSLAVFLLVLIAVSFTIYRKTSNFKPKKTGPCGLADVGDHLRSYLIQPHRIELQEVVGKGAFGVVHRGIFTRSKDKEYVAVKVLPGDTCTRQKLLREVELMCLVGRHERIVGLHGFTLDLEKMFLVLEFCPLGDLHTHLVTLKPKILRVKSLPTSEKLRFIESEGRVYGRQLCSYVLQVVQGMEYISSLKLVHGDLAARNILMLSPERVKIGDFGLSKDVYETQVYTSSHNPQAEEILPIKWMAPESIKRQKFTTHTDVWSFGVFMWEVFKLGKEPYPGLPNARVLPYLEMGFRLEQPHCDLHWYSIMKRCWRMDAKARPRFKELVKEIGALVDRWALYTPLQ